MIQEVGILRLGDLFQLVEGGDFTTLDDLYGQLHLGSLNPFRADRWMVWVDGQRLAMDLLDECDLNLLPVALHDVAYVEVVSVPQLFEGTFASQGLLHIHTKQPARGLSVRGSFWTGNESGDPGPLRYLNRAGSVEQLGPDSGGTIEWSGAWGWARASTITRSHHPTDAAILQRNHAMVDDWPRMEMIAPAVQLHINDGDGFHHFSAGFTALNDFFLMKSFGREIPAKTFFGWGGLNGLVPLAERTGLRYRTAYTVNRLAERANRRNLDFDWRLDLVSASVEVQRNGRTHTLTAGACLERSAARTAYRLTDDTYQRASVYARIQRIASATFRPDLALHLSTSGGDVALRCALTTRWRARPGRVLTGAIAFAEQLFEENYSLWYWVRRGYGFLDDLDVDYTFAGSIGKSRQLTADLGWYSTLTRDLTLDVQTFYRCFTGLAVERQMFQFDAVEEAFTGPVRIESGLGGHVLGGRFGVHYRFAPWLYQRFYASLQFDLAGDDLFRDTWQSLPTFRARSTWTLTPVPTFSMGAVFSYRSSSHWIDYALAETQSGGFYTATVPAAWTLDLSAHKWLWQRRVRGTIVVRNLFNRRYHYHPIGATFDLSLLVRLEFRLGADKSSRWAISHE